MFSRKWWLSRSYREPSRVASAVSEFKAGADAIWACMRIVISKQIMEVGTGLSKPKKFGFRVELGKSSLDPKP